MRVCHACVLRSQDSHRIRRLRRSAAFVFTPHVKLHPIHALPSQSRQRRLGTACRAACEPAATVALVRYVDTVAAHPAFASSAAATTTTLAPFLRAACAEAAASGVGGDRTSDSHGVGDDWLDNLVGAAVAASAPNGSERCDACFCVNSIFCLSCSTCTCFAQSCSIQFNVYVNVWSRTHTMATRCLVRISPRS